MLLVRPVLQLYPSCNRSSIPVIYSQSAALRRNFIGLGEGAPYMPRPCCRKEILARVQVGLRILALVTLVAVNCQLFAQGTADIVGTVTDNTGGVLASAKVTAKNLETSLTRSVETNASGEYAAL